MDARLWCPSCDAVRKPGEVDFERVPVRCGTCGTPIEVRNGQIETEKLPERRRTPVPENFRVESDDDYLSISYRPREFYGIDVTFVAMMGFLC